MATIITLDTTTPADVQPAAASRTRVIKALDGVRGFAILLVVWCHYDAFVRGPVGTSSISEIIAIAAHNASVGVLIFFVLSGFLLFLPYARTLVTPDQVAWPRASTFYLRRVRRIMPAYLTVFLAIVAVMLVVQTQAHHQLLSTALAQLPWSRLATGLFLIFDIRRSTFDLFAGVNPVIGYVDGPLWSLTVEWQFYLLLPLLAWALAQLRSLRRVLLALMLLIGCGLAIRGTAAWLHYAGGIEDPTTLPQPLGLLFSLLYGMRGKYLEVFALGMLISLFYVWAIEQRHWTPAQHRHLALLLLPFCGIGFVLCSLWATFGAGHYEGLDAFLWPSAARHGAGAISYAIAGDWLFSLCAAALLLSVLCLPRSLGAFFSLRPLTFLGLISYSLYLWHVPFAFTDIHAGAPLPPLWALVGIFAWSTALYCLVERPFLRYRTR